MSKITKAKKEAKLKGKAKSTTSTAKQTTAVCCHCKHYGKFKREPGHQCKLTGKPTPRKATCSKHDFK